MKRTRYPGITPMKGNEYRIRVVGLDPKTGRRKEVDRVVPCRSIAEAQAKRLEFKKEIEAGGEPEAERVRLADYARSWLAGKQGKIKFSTGTRYAQIFDLHILPRFGDYFLDAITRRDVQAWVDDMKREGISGATVAHHYAVLRILMREAEAAENIPRNPCRLVAVPSRLKAYSDEDPNILSPEQLARVLDHFKLREPKWYSLACALAFTGARFGEVSALTWGDVDESAGVITNPPVTVAGSDRHDEDRTRAHGAARQRAHRRPARPSGGSPRPRPRNGRWGDLVFPTRTGTMHHPSCLRKPLDRALASSCPGVRISVHGLRRSFNDAARKVAAREVTKSITGHVTDQMLLHYSHISVDEKRAAVERVMELLKGSTDERPESGDPSGDPKRPIA
jgi:integrase